MKSGAQGVSTGDGQLRAWAPRAHMRCVFCAWNEETGSFQQLRPLMPAPSAFPTHVALEAQIQQHPQNQQSHSQHKEKRHAKSW